jgi:protein PhnA
MAIRLASASHCYPRASHSLTTEPTMSELPKCPKCDADYTYLDGALFVCPSCAHEWSNAPAASDEDEAPEIDDQDTAVRDANGNILQTGDSVIVIKDLKVKGSSLVVKGGTKVKNIRLVDGDHDIDCKIDGIGAMQLKSEFVKKA